MSALPREILVLIFQELRLVDIENCAHVCVNWKMIIAHYFLNPRLEQILEANFDDSLELDGWTKNENDYNKIVKLYEKHKNTSNRILVTSGHPWSRGEKTEIIYLDRLAKNNPLATNVLPQREGSVGGLLDGHPSICGGFRGGNSIGKIFKSQYSIPSTYTRDLEIVLIFEVLLLIF